MKLSTTLLFLLFGCLSQCLAQYQIPGAQQQPAWVFPMYFEDGFGYRDTVYLGYDADARGETYDPTFNPIYNPDTIFGEVYHLIEQDSILHVNLRGGGITRIGIMFRLISTVLVIRFFAAMLNFR